MPVTDPPIPILPNPIPVLTTPLPETPGADQSNSLSSAPAPHPVASLSPIGYPATDRSASPLPPVPQPLEPSDVPAPSPASLPPDVPMPPAAIQPQVPPAAMSPAPLEQLPGQAKPPELPHMPSAMVQPHTLAGVIPPMPADQLAEQVRPVGPLPQPEPIAPEPRANLPSQPIKVAQPLNQPAPLVTSPTPRTAEASTPAEAGGQTLVGDSAPIAAPPTDVPTTESAANGIVDFGFGVPPQTGDPASKSGRVPEPAAVRAAEPQPSASATPPEAPPAQPVAGKGSSTSHAGADDRPPAPHVGPIAGEPPENADHRAVLGPARDEPAPEPEPTHPTTLAVGNAPPTPLANEPRTTMPAPISVRDLRFVTQVADRIQQQARTGTSHAWLRLQPESLGRVDVHLTLDSTGLHLQLNTETPEVGMLFERNLNQLRDALMQRGVNIHELSVSVSTSFGNAPNPSLSQHNPASSEMLSSAAPVARRGAAASDPPFSPTQSVEGQGERSLVDYRV